MAELEVEVEETTTETQEEQSPRGGFMTLEEWVEKGNDPKDHVADATEWKVRGRFIRKQEEQEAEIAELKRKTERTAELLTESNKKAYEKGLKEAEERHTKAVEEGDTAGAQKALDDVKDLTTAAQAPTANPFDEWVSDNDWFVRDRELFEFAESEDRFLSMQKGGKIGDVKAHMDEVKQKVMARFPEKFGNPARAEAPTTEAPAQRTRTSPKTKHTYKDLDETQKAFCDEFVSMGTMTRDEYVKSLVDSGELK